MQEWHASSSLPPFQEWIQTTSVQETHPCLKLYASILIESGATWDTFSGRRSHRQVVDDLIECGIPLLAAKDIEIIAYNKYRETCTPLAIFWDLSTPVIDYHEAASKLKEALRSYGALEKFVAYPSEISMENRTELRLAGCQVMDIMIDEYYKLSASQHILVDATRFVCESMPDRVAICIVTSEKDKLYDYTYLVHAVQGMRSEPKHRIIFASGSSEMADSSNDLDGPTWLNSAFEKYTFGGTKSTSLIDGYGTGTDILEPPTGYPEIKAVDESTPDISALSSEPTNLLEPTAKIRDVNFAEIRPDQNPSHGDAANGELSDAIGDKSPTISSIDSSATPIFQSVDPSEFQPKVLEIEQSGQTDPEVAVMNSVDPDIEAIMWGFGECDLCIANEFVLRGMLAVNLCQERSDEFPTMESVNKLIDSGIRKGIVDEYGTGSMKMIGMKYNDAPEGRSLIVFVPKGVYSLTNEELNIFHSGCTKNYDIFYFPQFDQAKELTEKYPSLKYNSTNIHVPINREKGQEIQSTASEAVSVRDLESALVVSDQIKFDDSYGPSSLPAVDGTSCVDSSTSKASGEAEHDIDSFSSNESISVNSILRSLPSEGKTISQIESPVEGVIGPQIPRNFDLDCLSQERILSAFKSCSLCIAGEFVFKSMFVDILRRSCKKESVSYDILFDKVVQSGFIAEYGHSQFQLIGLGRPHTHGHSAILMTPKGKGTASSILSQYQQISTKSKEIFYIPSQHELHQIFKQNPALKTNAENVHIDIQRCVQPATLTLQVEKETPVNKSAPNLDVIRWAFEQCKLHIAGKYVLKSSFNCEILKHHRKQFPNTASVNELVQEGIKKGICAEYGSGFFQLLGMVSNEKESNAMVIFCEKNKFAPYDTQLSKFQEGCTKKYDVFVFPFGSRSAKIINERRFLKEGHQILLRQKQTIPSSWASLVSNGGM